MQVHNKSAANLFSKNDVLLDQVPRFLVTGTKILNVYKNRKEFFNSRKDMLTRKSIKHKQPLQVRLVKSAITTTNELPQPKLVESSITPTKDPDKSNDPEGHLATNPCLFSA